MTGCQGTLFVVQAPVSYESERTGTMGRGVSSARRALMSDAFESLETALIGMDAR